MEKKSKQQWLTRVLGIITALGTLVGAVAAVRTWYLIEIENFSVEPLIISQGESVRLEWQVKNVSEITILPKPGIVNQRGNRKDTPSETTVYQLTAENLLFKEEAEVEVIVEPVAGQQVPDIISIDFSGFSEGLFLKGDEFAPQGITEIKAAPVGDYCQNTQAAILPAGSYRSNYSFLSTAEPGDLKRCNGVPLALVFDKPAKTVIIHFFGADKPYKLEAYRIDGTVIGHETARATPYDYRDFEIQITAAEGDIAAVTFGYTAALTMIRDIQIIR